MTNNHVLHGWTEDIRNLSQAVEEKVEQAVDRDLALQSRVASLLAPDSHAPESELSTDVEVAISDLMGRRLLVTLDDVLEETRLEASILEVTVARLVHVRTIEAFQVETLERDGNLINPATGTATILVQPAQADQVRPEFRSEVRTSVLNTLRGTDECPSALADSEELLALVASWIQRTIPQVSQESLKSTAPELADHLMETVFRPDYMHQPVSHTARGPGR